MIIKIIKFLNEEKELYFKEDKIIEEGIYSFNNEKLKIKIDENYNIQKLNI